jgi:hypothetical protein
MQTSVTNIAASNIETIDGAFLNYVENLNIHCTTINGWTKVPVIWSSAERSYQIKNNREIRDKNGSLIPPIISLERTSTTKDPSEKGSFWANVSPRDDRRVITKILNQEKTSNFANADSLKRTGQVNFITSKKNQKQVYKSISIPIPVYISVEYKINILTNYQAQMNEAVQPFMARTGQNYFIIQNESHRYECFMNQNFDQESITNLGEEERKYKTTITVKVLGYLIGEGVNQEKEQQKIEENPVEIKLPKENITFIQEDQKKKQIPLSQNAGVPLSSTVAIKRVFTIGNGIDSIYIVGHSLNSRDLYISIRSNSAADEYEKVEAGIAFIDLNNISIDMGNEIPIDSYVVTIIG